MTGEREGRKEKKRRERKEKKERKEKARHDHTMCTEDIGKGKGCLDLKH